jgi:hypothetical protein
MSLLFRRFGRRWRLFMDSETTWIKRLLIIALLAGPAGAAVKVDRKPADVQRTSFDPGHRPEGMPALKPDEAAVTVSRFDCEASMSYLVTSKKPHGSRCTTTLKVRGITITLELKIEIWLPKHASARLTDHEEGHRQITEQVYREAEAAARELATPLDGKVLAGDGADCAAAEKQTSGRATEALCHDYLDRIAKRASRINDIYDDITAHGTRKSPTVDEAIRQAFAQDRKQTGETAK